MNPEVTLQLVLLFILILIGFGAVRAKLIDQVGSDKISLLVSRITMPAMYIATFMAQDYSAEKMRQGGILLGISIYYYALAVAVGMVFVRLARVGADQAGVFRFMIVFSNAAYMGFPVLRAVLGEEAIFYGAIFNIPFNILAYSLGIWLLKKGAGGGAVKFREMALNPGTLGVLFGVLLFVLSPVLKHGIVADYLYSGPLAGALKMVGDMTVPLSMIVIGTVLAGVKFSAVVANLRIYLLCGVRLLLMPALMLLSLAAFPLPAMTRAIPVLIAGMPCAVFGVILAKEYGGDEKTASVGVFLSTLFSGLTIPLISLWIK